MSVLLKVEMVADFAIDLDQYIKIEEDRIRADIRFATEMEEPAENILALARQLERATLTRKALKQKVERAYDDHAAFIKTLNEMARSKTA